ncbi:hypothetical protein B0F90DRAFT_1821328 [Multifurca ochricompacta]|uniref:Uncharacterized protein n=1 Tax=Multifurca ochricompacta TaxID=376703 RepID=A0AAD4LXD8_9AGAM|nr:hypothetical protein B0F90DRAFT_1821328 [Multifurca ochricompacta]
MDAPPVHGSIPVKLALLNEGEVLLNEAKIYSAFPHELQEDCCLSLPQVVPKSYGYYQASQEAFIFTKNEWKEIRAVLRTFLLIEHCVETPTWANFIQGSPSRRNIVMQLGPLTVLKEERSLDNPPYPFLDLGRGLSADFGIDYEHPKTLAERKKAEMTWA